MDKPEKVSWRLGDKVYLNGEHKAILAKVTEITTYERLGKPTVRRYMLMLTSSYGIKENIEIYGEEEEHE